MTPADRLLASARVAALTDQHDRHAERMRQMAAGRVNEAELMARMAEALRLVPRDAVGPARSSLIAAALAAYDAWLMDRAG